MGNVKYAMLDSTDPVMAHNECATGVYEICGADGSEAAHNERARIGSVNCVSSLTDRRDAYRLSIELAT